MNIVTLDLEGVLIPEIWIAFAQASGIPELKRTTRDEPDYDKLMRYRLEIPSQNKDGGHREGDLDARAPAGSRRVYGVADVENEGRHTFGYV